MSRKQRNAHWALCAVALLLAAAAAGAADFYVSPSGAASGTGSIGNPWDLQTALDQPSAVHPGDTIWLRGGTYTGHFVSRHHRDLRGSDPVTQYPGERAKIDGNYGGNLTTFEIHGYYTWYWGFEIYNSDPGRWSDVPSDPPGRRGEGIITIGDHIKLINLIIRDTSQGILSNTTRRHRDLRLPDLLQRIRRDRSRPRPRDLLRERPGQRHEEDPRQHHLRAVRLRAARLHRGRRPRQHRVPGRHGLRQRRALEPRLVDEHPAGRPRRGGDSPHVRQHDVQPGPRGLQQSRLQLRVHQPDGHQQLFH